MAFPLSAHTRQASAESISLHGRPARALVFRDLRSAKADRIQRTGRGERRHRNQAEHIAEAPAEPHHDMRCARPHSQGFTVPRRDSIASIFASNTLPSFITWRGMPGIASSTSIRARQ